MSIVLVLLLLKIFHEEISNYWRKWYFHGYPVSLFVELFLRTKLYSCLYMFEVCQDILFKVVNVEFR